MSLLFSKTALGPLTLQNRLVMAPLTRNRATGNVPNELMHCGRIAHPLNLPAGARVLGPSAVAAACRRSACSTTCRYTM